MSDASMDYMYKRLSLSIFSDKGKDWSAANDTRVVEKLIGTNVFVLKKMRERNQSIFDEN